VVDVVELDIFCEIFYFSCSRDETGGAKYRVSGKEGIRPCLRYKKYADLLFLFEYEKKFVV